LVERGPGIIRIMVRQAERMQQLVIGAVKEDIVTLVDDDEGNRVLDFSVGCRFDAGHALRIGARNESLGNFSSEGRLHRRLKIFFVYQVELDIRARGGPCLAQAKIWNGAGIFIDDARYCEIAVDRAAGNDPHVDRVIEAPYAKRTGADPQIGSERECEKAALEFGRTEVRVLRRRAFE